MKGVWSRTALFLAAVLCALHCRLGSSQECGDTFNITESSTFDTRITVEGGVRTCFRCLFNGAVDPSTTWDAGPLLQPIGSRGVVTDGVLTVSDPTIIVPNAGGDSFIPLRCTAPGNDPYVALLNRRALVPPSITGPRTVNESDDLTLTCDHSTSVPVDRFYWVLPNGSVLMNRPSIVLTNIMRSSSGNYSCNVQDDRNNTVTTMVTITVQYAPVVTTTPSPQRIPRGNTLTLFCVYESVPPPDITWLFNSSPLSSMDPRITTTELRSELALGSLEESEGGTYTCSASNIVGDSSLDIEVIVQGPPDAPTNVMVTSADTNSLGVSWTNGNDGNSPITGVTIAFSARDDSRSQNFSGDASLQSATLTNLMPFRTYTISVFVVNAIGRSEPGNDTGTTLSLRLGAPTLENVRALNSRSIRVEWQPPMVNSDTTAGISSWVIEYEIEGNTQSRMSETVNDPAARSLNLTMLERGTTYSVRVAGRNVRGLGNWTQRMSVMTPVDPPTMPQGLSVNSMGAYALTVTWSAPADDGGRAIVNYKLDIREVGGSGTFVELDRVAGLSQTIRNSSQFIISENTTYEVRVAAFNGVVLGETFTAIGATEAIGAPQPLANAPTITNITNTSVDVSWPFPGGYVDFYTIQYKLSSIEWNSPDVNEISVMGFRTSVSINGLLPNTTYNLRIKTRNANGLSEFSPEATFTTLPPPPSVTIDGPATITAGQTVVLVCNVSRAVMVTWSRDDGRPLPSTPDGSVLRIPTPAVEDGGVYRCSAEGVVATFNLVVMDPGSPTTLTTPPPPESTPRTVVIIAVSVGGGVALVIFLLIVVIAVVCLCRWKGRSRNIYSVKNKRRVNWIETSTSYEERPPPRSSARTAEGTPSFDIPEDYTTHSSFNTLEKQNRIHHTASSEENLVGRDINYAQLDLEPGVYHPGRGQEVQYSNLTSSPTSFQYIPQDGGQGKETDWPDSAAPHYSNTVV